jgi:radical SAM protein with 4Fe4S-binding SPASM domain
MDILLRDYTHDTLPSQEYAEEIRDYFVAWINIWFSRDDKSVKIRMFDNVVNVLLGKRSHLEFAFNKNSLNSNYPTVTVYTDGDISPTDELTSINDDLMDTGKNLANDSLEDVFSIKVFGELREAQQNIPKDCDGCCWKYACRGGGGILEKFSSKNRFSNKSVYCKVWSELFPIVTSKLLSHGYPKEQLLNILTGENNASA